MKKIVLSTIIILGLIGCSQNIPTPEDTKNIVSQKGIAGHWYFDLKTSQSHATTKEEKYMLKSIVGEEMVLDNYGNFSSKGKKIGTYKISSNNQYFISTNRGKIMNATYKKPYLIVKDKSNMGEFKLYFTQKNISKNTKGIAKYIHLNKIYRQPKKIYDNGYLFYLFLEDGVHYSHVSHSKNITKDEIIQHGTKLKYKYLNNKIYIRASMFTITIESKNKNNIHTSQGDNLVLQ